MKARLALSAPILMLLASLQPLAESSTASRDKLFSHEARSMESRLIETRRHLHQHPELSGEEKETAAFVTARLREVGLEEIHTGIAGHGVTALLRGKQSGPCIAIRADMDALPIQSQTKTPWQSRNPGVMHACGHDVHTTIVLGVAELLSHHSDQLKGTIKFIFQPFEEGVPMTWTGGDWGAKRMIAEGVLENPAPVAIFGLHVAPRITLITEAGPGPIIPFPAGQVAWNPGIDTANSDRFSIVIRGKAAHASAPHFGVDAIPIAAEAITALQTIRSRATDPQNPMVLTIGTIQGGTAENILAESVTFSGTVRTYDEKLRDRVIELMHRTLKGVTEAHGGSYELTYRKGYPSVINDVGLTKSGVATLERVLGKENVHRHRPGLGGEDFAYYSRKIPALYLRLGVANEGKGITAAVHTPQFDIDDRALCTGVKAMAAVLCDFLENHTPQP